MGTILFVSFILSFVLLVREVYYKNLSNINMLSFMNSVLFAIMMLFFILKTTTSVFVALLALLPLWVIYRIIKMPAVLFFVAYVSNRNKS